MDDSTLQQLLPAGLNFGGTVLGAYNQQQQYNGLQNALNQIGPTQLNPFTMSGPGGMSSGYNTSGGAQINLGQLNPAFSNLAGVGAAGSGSYNPGLLSGLTGNAAGTLGLSTGALGSAYGNYNNTMGIANSQLGDLGSTYNSVFGNTLSSLQAQQQPQVQQQAFGLQNTLFGRGVLDSTGAGSGAIAAGNFGSQVNAMNAQNNLVAQQQALAARAAGVQNYGNLASSANGILSNAFNNFGGTNQLISGLNTAQLNNSLSAIQGAGALNTLGLNNYNAALGTGTAQGQVRNQSLFPFASTAANLAGTPNALGMFANGLTQMGSSPNALTGLFKGIGSLFGNGSNAATNYFGSDYGTGSTGMPDASATYQGNGDNSGDPSNWMPDSSSPPPSFNSAGGEAATPGLQQMTPDTSGLQAENFNFGSNSSSPTLGSSLGNAAAGLGIYTGLQRGGVAGYGSAALNGAKLYGNATGTSMGPGIGGLGGALNLYNGIKQGGALGYTNAAIGAGQLYGAASTADAAAGGAGLAGAGTVGAMASGLGLAMAPIALAMMFPGKLSAQYYKTMSDTLTKGPGSGQLMQGNQYSLDNVKQNTAYQGARTQLLQLLTNPDGQKVPYTSQQLQSFGITPQDIADYANLPKLGAQGRALAASEGIPNFSTASSQHK